MSMMKLVVAPPLRTMNFPSLTFPRGIEVDPNRHMKKFATAPDEPVKLTLETAVAATKVASDGLTERYPAPVCDTAVMLPMMP